MNFKFIHAADIHLDSPLLGLERYEGAPVEYVRGATRKALQNLVELALEENVKFVLIAGDLYDGDWRDYNTGLFFVSQMVRLREAGIRVYTVRGNHDAASQITRMLRLPDNMRDFSAENPETECLDDLGVAIHGQSFAVPAVSEDLSRRYPEPLRDYFNIGLLHTCATGREGHAHYAPCDTDYLKNKGYDYWALGHVHNREIINSNPWIVFPGNTQGRHIREEGDKGCALVLVRDGRVEDVKHRPLDVLRWSLCQVDADGAATYDDVLDRAEKNIDATLSQSVGRLLAVRLVVTGTSGAHEKLISNPSRLNNDLRAIAVAQGLDSIWVEKVKIKTSPPPGAEELLSSSPVASLLQYIKHLGNDEQFFRDLLSELEQEIKVIPADLFATGEMDPRDITYLHDLLPEAEELILTRLLGKGVAAGDH